MSGATERLNLLLSLRRYAEGEKAAREAIAEAPEWGAGYAFLALFLLNLYRLAEATEAARTAVGKGPHDPWAHAVLGLTLSQRGKFNQALRAAREAVRLDLTYSYAREVLVRVLCSREEYAAALTEAIEGLRESPDNEDLLYWKGWAELELGRIADAIRSADAGLQRHPRSDPLLNLRGSVLLHRAEWWPALAVPMWFPLHRDAHAAFWQAARLRPDEPAYAHNLTNNSIAWRERCLKGAWYWLLAFAAALGCLTVWVLHLPRLGFDLLWLVAVGWVIGYLAPLRRVEIYLLAAPLNWIGVPPIPMDPVDRRAWRDSGIGCAIALGIAAIIALTIWLKS
jgi:tetratricopeptide (TPR) repeat protein